MRSTGTDAVRPRYAAFISYSRAVDGHLAPALRDALQRFAKPWYRPRALRVFRDDAALAANPGLWSSIVDAMESSEYFILLASPEAAASVWVNQEVEYWLTRRSSDRLLIAITDGDIGWDRTINDFDRRITTCIPPDLYGRLAEEPRWVDLRDVRREEHLSLRAPQFRDRVADLAAPLHGLSKDDLVGADIRQHRRTQRLVRATIAVLAVLTLLAGTATIVAIDNARTANQQRALAEEQRRVATAALLRARADDARATNPRRAARLGLAAHYLDDSAESRANLVQTAVDTPIAASLTGHVGFVLDAAFSPDGRTLASAGVTVTLWDVGDPARTGAPCSRWRSRRTDASSRRPAATRPCSCGTCSGSTPSARTRGNGPVLSPAAAWTSSSGPSCSPASPTPRPARRDPDRSVTPTDLTGRCPGAPRDHGPNAR